MKNTLKKPMITFFVLSLVCVVAWMVGYVLLWAGLLGWDFAAFFQGLLNEFTLFGYFFMGQIHGWAFEGGAPSYLTYVGIAVAAFALVMLVVGFVLTIVRKRARYIPFILVWFFATFAALNLSMKFTLQHLGGLGYLDLLTASASGLGDPNVLTTFIYTLVVMVFAALSYVFMIFAIFFGLAHAKRLLLAKKGECEEEIELAPSQDDGEAFTSNEANAIPALDVRHEDYNTMQDFVSEPEEQLAQPEEIVVEEVPANKDAVTKDDLASILKDVVRDIVRDEIARANVARAEEERAACDRHADRSITGATFGGPLVVQYFNGGINGQGAAPVSVPAPAPAPKKEEKPAPKAEEKKPEAPAPAPAPAPVSAEESSEGKNPIIRIPFTERMLSAEKEMQENYNELKNEILSYGVNSRVSNSGDTFRLHRKTYVKITIAGKSLKLYFALNPADYAESKMPIGDASHHAVYAEIPLIFKVKSGLSLRRAKELIRDVMTPDGLVQGDVESVNWVKELKAAAKK